MKSGVQNVVYRWYANGYSVALRGPGAVGLASTGGQWHSETEPSTDLGSGYYTEAQIK